MKPEDAHAAAPASVVASAATPGITSRPAGYFRHLADERLQRRTALGAVLLLPIVVPYSRGIGDVLLSVVAVLFLLHRIATRDWQWIAAPWTALALAFWVWQLGVSVAVGDGHQIVESLVLVRLFLFVAALETWVLAEPRARRWLGLAVLAMALWVGIECWQQYLTGRNLFGDPRWGDGSLTGPMSGPRAGATYVYLAFPAFLPWLAAGIDSPGRARHALGFAGLVLMAVTQVLIGQRMPTMLMLLGLCTVALWLPRWRLPVISAVAAGMLLAGLTAIISPPTFGKLVVHFSDQLEHFKATPYAALFERALVMAAAHPWLGLGFDGFRDHCMDPIYLHNLAWLTVADPTSRIGCSIHPHNYYLQVLTGAGVIGLALFVLLGLAWLWRLGRGAGASPVRVGLFVSAVITLWPIASTTSLFTLPNAALVFLMIGWGLAEAGASQPVSARGRPPRAL